MITIQKRFIAHALVAVGITNNASICHAAPAALNSYRMVAMSGQPAPGAPAGMVFTGLVNPVINNRGETAFVAGVYDPASPGSDRIGIWSESGGGLHLVALDGLMPQGVELPSYNLPFGSVFAFNDRGETVFQTTDGIWRDNGDSIELVAGGGRPVTIDNQLVRLSTPSRPVINGRGDIAFAARHHNTSGIYVRRNGETELIADMLPPPPGTEERPQASLVTPPLINDLGHLAFRPFISSYYRSLWTNVRGQFEQIAWAQSQDFLPGDSNFRELQPPIITATGDVVFFAGLTGEGVTEHNNATLWRFDAGGLRMLVREGDQAPGLPDGLTFGSINYLDSISPRAVSDDAGNLAFGTSSVVRVSTITTNTQFGGCAANSSN